jgi:hypothetical protein
MKLLAGLARTFAVIFGLKRFRGPSKSRLMGLYLSQANGREHGISEISPNRQRRNGKFSHTRERA